MNTNFAFAPVLFAGLIASGCGGAPTSPGPAEPGADASGSGPALTNVQVRYTGQALLVTAALAPWQPSRFDPEHGGGWCFQLFLDTDERPTGYGSGLDYLVRAIEITRGGSVHVRRTQGGGGPGGWGESVGLVNLAHEGRRVAFVVPLEMLDDDDGQAGFILELYETFEKEDGSVWHEFVVGYEGTSVPITRTGSRITMRREAVAAGALRRP